MLFDPKRRTLVAASVQPKAWKLTSRDRTTTAGHTVGRCRLTQD